MATPSSTREDERLARLADYRILDTPPEPAFDDLARRAREAVRAPMAWVAFDEGEREWVKAGAGIAFAELSGARRLLHRADPSGAAVEIEDMAATPLRMHPLVAGEPHMRFLCAMPLTTPEGHAVGALAVADRVPRRLTPMERSALRNLATLAMARLEARRAHASGDGLVTDAETFARAQELLARERELSDAVIENLPGVFVLFSGEGTILRWNARLQSASGCTAEEMAMMQPLDFIAPGDRAKVDAAIAEVMRHGREVTIEAELIDKAGVRRPFALTGKPLRVAGETCLMGLGHDISEGKRAEERTLRAKERLDLALAGSSLALWDWDLASDRVYFNEGWAAMVGASPQDSTVAWEEVRAWTHPEDSNLQEAAVANAVRGVSEEFECEYRIRHASGEWIWIYSRGKVTQRDGEGKALRMTGTSTNVSKRKEAEERAEYLATRDSLTGLPNRVLLHDRLEQGIVNAARNKTGFAFMFIDLDRFKTINDSLGHDVGDELLKRVAARLGACVRASDTVARLGGDEFAVILENLRDTDDEGAQQVAEKMIQAMASPILIGGQHLNTSCSIGISLYPFDGKDSATLMKHADVAMYYAKDKGRNNYQFFSSEMNARAQDRLAIENYLRLALRRNELVLHYQPRIRMSDGALTGMEALVRWSHPRRGLLAPDRFIDVAEDSGLIVPIGEWVLECACRQASHWRRTLGPGFKLSVNLSVGQIADAERLFRAVEGALHASGLEPSVLELELTESILMQNLDEKAALLNRLGKLGVSLSIDDFGTGYSSLAYLKSLPVDAIKIDSSFVRDIGLDPDDEAIVRAIIAMAHSLRLLVIAEGVETEAQFSALKALGCDEYQGYYTSRALPPADFERRFVRQAPA